MGGAIGGVIDFNAIGSGVNSIFSCIAGVVGCVGLARYAAQLMLVPMGYSAVSLILGIVATALIGLSTPAFVVAPIISIGVTILIMLLFYNNYIILKRTDPLGSSNNI